MTESAAWETRLDTIPVATHQQLVRDYLDELFLDTPPQIPNLRDFTAKNRSSEQRTDTLDQLYEQFVLPLYLVRLQASHERNDLSETITEYDPARILESLDFTLDPTQPAPLTLPDQIDPIDLRTLTKKDDPNFKAVLEITGFGDLEIAQSEILTLYQNNQITNRIDLSPLDLLIFHLHFQAQLDQNRASVSDSEPISEKTRSETQSDFTRLTQAAKEAFNSAAPKTTPTIETLRPQHAPNALAQNWLTTYHQLWQAPSNPYDFNTAYHFFMDSEGKLVTQIPIGINDQSGVPGLDGTPIWEEPSKRRKLKQDWLNQWREHLATEYPSLEVVTDKNKERPAARNYISLVRDTGFTTPLEYAMKARTLPAAILKRPDGSKEVMQDLLVGGAARDPEIPSDREAHQLGKSALSRAEYLRLHFEKVDDITHQPSWSDEPLTLPNDIRTTLGFYVPGLAAIESGYNPSKVSYSNALGILQQLPAFWENYGDDADDPISLEGQTRAMQRYFIDVYHRWKRELGPELEQLQTNFFAGDESAFNQNFIVPALLTAYNRGGGSAAEDNGIYKIIKSFAENFSDPKTFRSEFGNYSGQTPGLDVFYRMTQWAYANRASVDKYFGSHGLGYFPAIHASSQLIQSQADPNDLHPHQNQRYVPDYEAKYILPLADEDPRRYHEQVFGHLIANSTDAETLLPLLHLLELPNHWNQAIHLVLKDKNETELATLSWLPPETLRATFIEWTEDIDTTPIIGNYATLQPTGLPAREYPSFEDLKEIVERENRKNIRPEKVDPNERLQSEASAKLIIRWALRNVRARGEKTDEAESGLRHADGRTYLNGLRSETVQVFESLMTDTGLMSPASAVENDQTDAIYENFIEQQADKNKPAWYSLGYFLNETISEANEPDKNQWSRLPTLEITGGTNHDSVADRSADRGHFAGRAISIAGRHRDQLLSALLGGELSSIKPKASGEAINAPKNVKNIVGGKIFAYPLNSETKTIAPNFYLFPIYAANSQGVPKLQIVYIRDESNDPESGNIHIETIPWENYTKDQMEQNGFTGTLKPAWQATFREHVLDHIGPLPKRKPEAAASKQ